MLAQVKQRLDSCVLLAIVRALCVILQRMASVFGLVCLGGVCPRRVSKIWDVG